MTGISHIRDEADVQTNLLMAIYTDHKTFCTEPVRTKEDKKIMNTDKIPIKHVLLKV